MSALVCDLSAIPDHHRARHLTLFEEFRTNRTETQELAEGYQFQFPNDSALLLHITEWISYERLCCPFFKFTLEITGGAFSLAITGQEGVKTMLAELAE